MRITNQQLAFDVFKKDLVKKGYTILSTAKHNKGRAELITAKNKENHVMRYWVLYKDDFYNQIWEWNDNFRNFAKDFPDMISYKGKMRGESINEDCVNKAHRSSVDDIVFVHGEEDEDVFFFVTPNAIVRFCEKYKLMKIQKKKNGYRTPDYAGGLTTVYERTYSFPISLMHKQVVEVEEKSNVEKVMGDVK